MRKILCSKTRITTKSSPFLGSIALTHSYTIIVTVPEPVTNLATKDVDANSWTLSWSYGNGSLCPPDIYYVEYDLVVKDQCEPIGDPDKIAFGRLTNMYVTITGLQSYSTYKVYVHPVNDLQFGEAAMLIGQTSEAGKVTVTYKYRFRRCR